MISAGCSFEQPLKSLLSQPVSQLRLPGDGPLNSPKNHHCSYTIKPSHCYFCLSRMGGARACGIGLGLAKDPDDGTLSFSKKKTGPHIQRKARAWFRHGKQRTTRVSNPLNIQMSKLRLSSNSLGLFLSQVHDRSRTFVRGLVSRPPADCSERTYSK